MIQIVLTFSFFSSCGQQISAAHTNKHKNESNSFNGYLLAFSRFFIFVLIVCFGLFWFYPFG